MPKRGQRGASLVEYALLVALIAIVCIAAIAILAGSSSDQGAESTTTEPAITTTTFAIMYSDQYEQAVVTQLEEELKMEVVGRVDYDRELVTAKLIKRELPCQVAIRFKAIQNSESTVQFWTDTPVSLQITTPEEALAFVKSECDRLN